MDSAHDVEAQLAALASYLGARREAVLRGWRKAIDRDPEMTTGASLPRAQLDDHIPGLLDTFGKRLQATPTAEETVPFKAEAKGEGSAHGLQRWQQGYDVREVTREWGRLQLSVADELERYASSHHEVDPRVMTTARRIWGELCTDGASESVAKYFQLQQIEANGQVLDLSRALEQLRELERSRAEHWRQAAHDLRGNVGVVMNATAGLAMPGVAVPSRENFLRILQKNVSSLYSLLEDVMDLARLQAGHERREVKAFDAAMVLRELCERMQPIAAERGLFLKVDGPDTLPVEGDAVKTQRIAQNLLLNALKYTLRGGVTVSWGDSRQNDVHRWMLCVADTGPGFHAGPGAGIAGAFEEATDEARQVEETARTGLKEAADETTPPSAAAVDTCPVHQQRGEGIGYPSSNVSASCSTRASKWTPRSARAPSFASFSLEVTALLKTSSCALLAHPRNHQSRACRWQALFLFDQASSGLARQALWRDWSDDSRFPVATSENPGIGEGEGTRGPGRATVFRNCEHFDRLLTSSYFGAPSGHTDDHLVHSLVKRCATRGEEVRPITSNVAAFDP